jgi:hypothetical protein
MHVVFQRQRNKGAGCDNATREEMCGCGSAARMVARKEMRRIWRRSKEGNVIARSAHGRRQRNKRAEEDEGGLGIVESGYVQCPRFGVWVLDLEHGIDRHWFTSTH